MTGERTAGGRRKLRCNRPVWAPACKFAAAPSGACATRARAVRVVAADAGGVLCRGGRVRPRSVGRSVSCSYVRGVLDRAKDATARGPAPAEYGQAPRRFSSHPSGMDAGAPPFGAAPARSGAGTVGGHLRNGGRMSQTLAGVGDAQPANPPRTADGDPLGICAPRSPSTAPVAHPPERPLLPEDSQFPVRRRCATASWRVEITNPANWRNQADVRKIR
jgi:hypothetical protein